MSKERNYRYMKNVVSSTIFLGISAILGYILVPISLDYLGTERYGLWAVLGSVFMWLGLLNLGYGGGLHFHLTGSLARREISLARQYISTTYAIFTIMGLVFLVIFFCLNIFLDWSFLFNTPSSLVAEMNTTVVAMAVLFTMNFLLSLINTVYISDQRNRVVDLFTLSTNGTRIIVVLLISRYYPSSLVLYCLGIQGSVFFANLAMSILGYTRKYYHLRPSLANVKFTLVRSYSHISLKFMYFQVALVVTIVANNILIAHLLGPEYATPYNIALQYVSVGTFLFRMILAPSGSAMIEAHAVSDIGWIKKTLLLFIKLWLLFFLVLIVMTLISPLIYPLWIGNKVNISLSLTFIIMIAEAMANWNAIFSSYIIGTGKLRMILISSTIRILIHVPLAIVLVRYFNLGIEGIALSSALCAIFPVIILPVQSYLLINSKARGLWNK